MYIEYKESIGYDRSVAPLSKTTEINNNPLPSLSSFPILLHV